MHETRGNVRFVRKSPWTKLRPYLPPIVIALGWLAGYLVIHQSEALTDDANRNLAGLSLSLLCGASLVLWFVLFSGFFDPAGKRRSFLVLLGIVALGLACFKVDGFDGNLSPKIRFRWAKPKDQILAETSRLPGNAKQSVYVPLDRLTDSLQFFGSQRNGQVPGDLEPNWRDRHPRLLWQQEMGSGWSSFAVTGDYAFTLEQRADQELTTCYEIKTGAAKWSHADTTRFESTVAGIGPRTTPTIVGKKIVSLGGTGILNCLNIQTGKLIWSKNILDDNGADLPVWGKSCSPLIINGKVIVSAGGPDGHSLVAYDLEDGHEIWSAGSSSSSYSSPVLVTLCGQEQILIVNADDVTSHDPDTGHILWTHPWTTVVTRVGIPIALSDDRVLLSAGYGVGCAMIQLRRESSESFEIETLWTSRALKPKFTNLIVKEGFAFGIDDGKNMVCLDLSDGEVAWRKGRFGHGQTLLMGEHLIVQCENGDVALLEASPASFRELGRFKALDGICWNIPTISGRYLLVRNSQEAACFELALARNSQTGDEVLSDPQPGE